MLEILVLIIVLILVFAILSHGISGTIEGAKKTIRTKDWRGAAMRGGAVVVILIVAYVFAG
ncbi:hypothetical protein NHU_04123 [Rhodovulum sulfidophilum]|uniref:Uncharacterized protein n=1 Tax=Rhodovulum sulfidophilum TaxID=35806 RepID=A0A0D6AX91_RHOSU|nr:hypothetical protein [Rhodovulum sulfidophilum]MCE8438677.1 hypothetical protein [Rhodovulum sulfidophilum]MCE8471902.1 hypothetical protein [Rhodovulum sulfidophilum]BAQ67215.1 hypothetical protein NHU_00043 [Rhodovulum sulfidophilum]BAQ71245.1 hypothetical protein NHU_04123 [Rhodovulum sulfidophilum]